MIEMDTSWECIAMYWPGGGGRWTVRVGGGLRPLLLITADINVSATTVDNSIVQYSTLQYSTVCIGRPHYCWYVIMRSSMDLYLYVCGPNKMFRDAWKCHRTFTTSGKTVETTEESWVLQNTQIFWRQGTSSCARSANLLFEGKKC